MPITQSFAGLSILGFGAFPGGDFEAISSVTVGSGGASSIDFTGIGTDWQHLQMRVIARNNQTPGIDAQGLSVRFNSDTGSNYCRHNLTGNGSAASAVGFANQTILYPGYVTTTTAGSDEFSASIIDIIDYGSTTKNTTVRGFAGHDGNGAGFVGVFSGAWLSTDAVLSITLATTGNFLEHSTAALYGVKAP